MTNFLYWKIINVLWMKIVLTWIHVKSVFSFIHVHYLLESISTIGDDQSDSDVYISDKYCAQYAIFPSYIKTLNKIHTQQKCLAILRCHILCSLMLWSPRSNQLDWLKSKNALTNHVDYTSTNIRVCYIISIKLVIHATNGIFLPIDNV